MTRLCLRYRVMCPKSAHVYAMLDELQNGVYGK